MPRLIIMIFFLLVINVKHAGAKPPTPTDCNNAVIYNFTSSMDFGTYASGSVGTISMPPVAGGTMIYDPAVTGVPESVAIPTIVELTTTLPQCQNGNLVLSTTAFGNGSTIIINPLTDIDPPVTNFKLQKNQPYILTIGGTLTVGPDPTPGTYTSGIIVEVIYP